MCYGNSMGAFDVRENNGVYIYITRQRFCIEIGRGDPVERNRFSAGLLTKLR